MCVANLSGGCRGDKDSDRTGGQAAVQDFQPFVAAGITTFDTAGDHLMHGSQGAWLPLHEQCESIVSLMMHFNAKEKEIRKVFDLKHNLLVCWAALIVAQLYICCLTLPRYKSPERGS